MKKSDLKIIWKQVPVDYYQKSIQTNLLQRFWHRQKIKTFEKILGPKKIKKVLDVGCASGYMTNEISKILPQSQVWGVDIYSQAINFGRKKYPHLQLKTANAANLPFKDGSFDLVVCYETIEHVLQPPKVLKEIQRVLKRDGWAIVAMDSGSFLFRTIWFLWENTKGKVWKKAHLHPFKHQDLEELIRKSGFKIKKKKFSHLKMEVTFLLRPK